MWYEELWGKIPLSPRIKKNQLARGQNWREFQNIFMSQFTFFENQWVWDGFPDSVDLRTINRLPIMNGLGLLADYKDTLISLGAIGGDGVSLNGYPTGVFGYGYNGFNHRFNAYVPGSDDMAPQLLNTSSGRKIDTNANAVILWDNPEGYPFILYIIQAARRMADIMRCMDVACKTMRTPFVIQAEQASAKSISDLMDKYDENVWTIITTNGFSVDSLKLWPTNANPQMLDYMWQYFCNVDGRLMHEGGITNNPQADKHERLLVSEVSANNIATQLNLKKRLHERELFCDRVNRLFGLHTSVKFVGEELQQNVSMDGTAGANDAPGDRKNNDAGADGRRA